MMTAKPTVFLVDDDPAMLDALAMLIESARLGVQRYPSAQAFINSYSPERPGCLVLDVRMPDMNGLQLQEFLAARNIKIPIIFITGHGNIPMSVRAVKAGAVDFLEKPFTDQDLLNCISDALARDAAMRTDEHKKALIRQRVAQLTPREREVMLHVVAGKSNKEIAATLDLSHRTVEIHRSRVFSKMKAASLAELVAMALASGICSSKQWSDTPS
jgi:two-component system response regulator FixJ